ncbi:MAG: hypothetical protein LBR84_10195 [Tannerella sp.]|jgi:tetratricopeptide (TPR) repeat protein|nr:hypothetical protein [Tannerella sp.]
MDIIKTYEQAIEFIDRKELKAAFYALQQLVSERGASMFQDELNSLRETYGQLLYYYTKGTKDPMRDKIYNELLASAYELADRAKQKLLIDISSAAYYSEQRTLRHQSLSIANLIRKINEGNETDNLAQVEVFMPQLFKAIWATDYLKDNDETALRQSLNDNVAEEHDDITALNCQIVASLLLGLQEVFDKRKMILLIDTTFSKDEEVRIRAYISLMIILYLYRNRLECYPEIGKHLDSLAETTQFVKIISYVIKRFILSRDTEKISLKINDEIMPEMMKLTSKFFGGKLENDSEHDRDNPDDLMNPEWLNIIDENPNLKNKLEEYQKLQEEGADVMHSTFIKLKNYPFFNEISHWFLPFNKGISLLCNDHEISEAMEVFNQVKFMCNSDLFSFYFSIKQVPEQQRKFMIDNIISQMSEFKENIMSNLMTKDYTTECIVSQFIQDLYRFHKLYPRRNEHKDIFAQKLDIHNIPLLQSYLDDNEFLAKIAELYLRNNYCEDALVVYERLEASASEINEELYQKMGYCRQIAGDFKGALKDYTKADLINPDSKWLLRRMAQCFRATHETQKALEYYLRHDKLEPDNIPILVNIGSCYLELKNYTEAMKYFFKVDYLDTKKHRAWRPIAWCSFLIGNYEQARKYYKNIMDNKPDSQDFMNAGHTELALQNIETAVELYKKSIETANGDFESFRKDFERDIPELTSAGIDQSDIALIIDILQ